MRRPAVAELLGSMPPESAELTRALLAAANERNLSVYLVGGPVRDWLLERPLRDVDLILEPSGIPAEVLARAAAPEGARIQVHDRFGTVALEAGSARIDVATSRREHYDHDGALPRVEHASVEEDLHRRDFSVNALAIPLSRAARKRHADVVDPTGGLEDLQHRRLRILHRRSFCDDPTRVLRAARLAPRLGFSLSRSSRSALQDALRDGAFGRVSGERLRAEFVKLFEDALLGLDPVRGLRLLSEWHVLGALEPGLSLDASVAPVIRRVGRAVATPPWKGLRWRPWVSGLMVWLAPHPAQLRQRVLRRFAVRGALAERIAGLPKLRDRTLRSLTKARGRGAIDAALRELAEEELHALHAWASPALRRRIARFAEEDRHRRLPINGVDLAQLGLAGPEIGRALEHVRLAVLDGTVRSRDEALAIAREIGQRRKVPTRRERELPRRG